MSDFSALDDDTYHLLYRYSVALTGCSQLGFDVLQEAILKWSKCDQDAIEQPLAYIKKMIRNQTLDQIKTDQRRERILEENCAAMPDTNVERDLETLVIDQLRLDSIWETLNHSERELLYLWGVEGMSAREIALHLHSKRSTILSQMSRLKKRLQQTFTEGESKP